MGVCVHAEVSAAFEDLIACLLDKNPATRISWEELPHHPFWGSPLPEAGIPEQPLLDAFINENGLAPSTQDTESQQVSLRLACCPVKGYVSALCTRTFC